MKKHFYTAATLLALGAAMPASAQSVTAPANLNHEQLMAWAQQADICAGTPLVDARYQGRRQVKITCAEATGFVPVAAGVLGGLGAGAGATAAAAGLGIAAVAAAAGGGGGSTNNTTN